MLIFFEILFENMETSKNCIFPKNNLLVRRVELEISTSDVDTIIKGHYSCDTLNETSDYPRNNDW